MSDAIVGTADSVTLRRKALARWDNEGGAGPLGPQRQALRSCGGADADPPALVAPALRHIRYVDPDERDLHAASLSSRKTHIAERP